MDLTNFFADLARTYDRLDGLDTAAQRLLKKAPQHLAQHAPPGIVIRGSGGKGVATYTPMVGFFDPDETESPQRGVYVVFILSEDSAALALSLNQGMEVLRHDLGDRAARERLGLDAAAIRQATTNPHLKNFSDAIELNSSGARQKAYVAGNIACRMYEVNALPTEAVMRSDLHAMLLLYEDAVATKRWLLTGHPGAVVTPSGRPTPRDNPLVGFKPKDDADYRTTIVGRELVKSRRHETLITSFAQHAVDRGWTPSSEHPQDLVLRRNGEVVLVEAKVVRAQNVTDAVRAAVGQLLSYAYFLYPPAEPPLLVGLFTQDIGEGYRSFLDTLRIASIWWARGEWHGSRSALSLGLAG